MSPVVSTHATVEPVLVRFSLRLRADFLAEIEQQADEQDRSVNWMLNHAVGEYLDSKAP